MIHYHVLADVAAEHRNALLAEGTARRLARHALRPRGISTAPRHSTRYDVVVVGSRCAGAATAMLLARAGHRVALVDRTALPSDTLSTHGIARDGVVQLSRWGLLDAVLAGGAPPARRVTFGVEGEVTIRAIKARAGVDMLVAPRRYALDALIADAARDAGADVLTEITATGVLRDPSGRVTGIATRERRGRTGELTGRFIVGADGLRSSIARFVGAKTVESYASDAGLFYAHVASPAWEGYEFHLAESSFAGVSPLTTGRRACGCPVPCPCCVPSAGPARDGPTHWSASCCALRRASANALAPDRSPHRFAALPGCPTTSGRATARAALVGDAGYHRDPITGHGMTDAFRDAELLAIAISSALRDPGSEPAALAGYRRARDAALRETFDLTRALTGFPPLSRFVQLQLQFAEALDREAMMLASLPASSGAAQAAPAA